MHLCRWTLFNCGYLLMETGVNKILIFISGGEKCSKWTKIPISLVQSMYQIGEGDLLAHADSHAAGLRPQSSLLPRRRPRAGHSPLPLLQPAGLAVCRIHLHALFTRTGRPGHDCRVETRRPHQLVWAALPSPRQSPPPPPHEPAWPPPCHSCLRGGQVPRFLGWR